MYIRYENTIVYGPQTRFLGTNVQCELEALIYFESGPLLYTGPPGYIILSLYVLKTIRSYDTVVALATVFLKL